MVNSIRLNIHFGIAVMLCLLNVLCFADEPPKPPPLESFFKLEFERFGCVQGFGGWTEPPNNPEKEINCDEENLKKFADVLGKCTDRKQLVNRLKEVDAPLLYDLDKNGCATCDDFRLWKSHIAQLYKDKKRITDGAKLTIEQCKNN